MNWLNFYSQAHFTCIYDSKTFLYIVNKYNEQRVVRVMHFLLFPVNEIENNNKHVKFKQFCELRLRKALKDHKLT